MDRCAVMKGFIFIFRTMFRRRRLLLKFLLVISLVIMVLQLLEDEEALSRGKQQGIQHWRGLHVIVDKGEHTFSCDCTRYNTFFFPPRHDKVIPSNISGATQFIGKVPPTHIKRFNERTYRPLRKVNGWRMYLFSAVGRNFTYSDPWEHISVNVWISKKLLHTPLRCCLLFGSGNAYQGFSRQKTWFTMDNLLAVQVVCLQAPLPFPEPGHPVGLTLATEDCSTKLSQYVKPVYPVHDTSACSFAVCLKVAYGKIDPHVLIEWIVYHRDLGVAKILVFTYEISSEVDHILTMYQHSGFVERLPFDFPRRGERRSYLGQKVPKGWTDEQIAVFDCQDRLAGFQYMAIIDLDEFIAPVKQTSLCGLMTELSEQYPNTAGFYLPVEMHVLDWQTNITHQLPIIPQYIEKIDIRFDRTKCIHRPQYIQTGSLTTHVIQPCDGCKRVKVSSEYVVLKHFRSCRKVWQQGQNQCSKPRNKDFYMRDRFQHLVPQLQLAKKLLQDFIDSNSALQ